MMTQAYATEAEARDAAEPRQFLGRRAQEVANWLAARFADNPRWLAAELDLLARRQGFDLNPWWSSPPVQALGIRGYKARLPWEPYGRAEVFLTTEPDPENTAADAAAEA